MTTTTTTNLRSTGIITDYVKTCDAIARHELLTKELRKKEKQLRSAVLAEIGERRAVSVRGTVRILEPAEKTSIACAVDDEAIVEYCRAKGLAFNTRTAEYCHPQTFAKYVREGLIPDELVERTTERIVTIH